MDRLFKPFFLGCLAFAAFATCGQVRAQSTPAPSPTPSSAPDRWQARITPYVWLPTINANLRFSQADTRRPSGAPPLVIPSGANVQVGPNNYLSNLNSAFMFTADVRKGNGGVFTDLLYLNISSDKAFVASLNAPDGSIVIPANVSTSAHMRSTLWTLALTGSPFGTSASPPLEGFVGFRYFSIKASADWSLAGQLGALNPTGGAEKTETQFVPIAGIKGRLGLGPHWFVPYYADYGTNSALETWQGVLGVGYGYHSGAALLVWRQLSYFQQNQPNELIQNLHLGGPAVGWTFNL